MDDKCTIEIEGGEYMSNFSNRESLSWFLEPMVWTVVTEFRPLLLSKSEFHLNFFNITQFTCLIILIIRFYYCDK